MRVEVEAGVKGINLKPDYSGFVPFNPTAKALLVIVQNEPNSVLKYCLRIYTVLGFY